MPRGRKALLTPEKWDELRRRHSAGENISALAREVGVSRSLVSSKVSTKVRDLKSLAIQKITVDQKIEKLPTSDRAIVVNFMDVLRAISGNLASAANYGAVNAARLNKMAHTKLKSFDPKTINTDAGAQELRNIAALTATGNEAAKIALGLLQTNKTSQSQADEEQTSEAEYAAAKAKLRAKLGVR